MNTGPTAAWCEVQDVLKAAPKMGHARSLRERVAFLEERLREEVERRMELEVEALDYDLFKERFEEQIDDEFVDAKDHRTLEDERDELKERCDGLEFDKNRHEKENEALEKTRDGLEAKLAVKGESNGST